MPSQQPSSYARPGGKHHLSPLSSNISVCPGSLSLTPDKILGTKRTWLREGRRNNTGFPVPFSVTKKISFEITIFKVKKTFVLLKDVIFTHTHPFFFEAEQDSCILWSFLGSGRLQRGSKLWDIQFYSCICRLAAGRPVRAEGTFPVPLYRVRALEHQGTSSYSTIKTGRFQTKGTAKRHN